MKIHVYIRICFVGNIFVIVYSLWRPFHFYIFLSLVHTSTSQSKLCYQLEVFGIHPALYLSVLFVVGDDYNNVNDKMQ